MERGIDMNNISCWGCNEAIEIGDKLVHVQVINWGGTKTHVCHQLCGLTLVKHTNARTGGYED